MVEDLFGADWLTERELARKGRVRTRPVRASKKIDDEKEQ